MKQINQKIEELFIPYEIALQLKEKGFNEPCLAYYNVSNILVNGYRIVYIEHESSNPCKNNPNSIDVTVPLYQQVIDWFREKHRYHIDITFRESKSNKIEGINSVYYDIEIYHMNGGDAYKTLKISEYSDHYYVCLIKAIEEALKLIK